MPVFFREQSERRYQQDRRAVCDRRGQYQQQLFSSLPEWNEQCIQYISRYLLLAISFVYLNYFKPLSFQDATFWVMNGTLLSYALINTINILHARKYPVSEKRFLITMWIDIVAVTLVVLVDPVPGSPTLLLFLMVALGNGMRYGMRMFAQAVTGCIAGAAISLLPQLGGAGSVAQQGTVITVIFLSIFLLYAYFLMTRIDRRQRNIIVSSRTDQLTTLLNRGSLYEVADTMFRNAAKNNEHIALLFADLDKFKAVNDTHGHAVGDVVLTAVADIIKRSLRQSDIAGRFGGDEFVILLPNMTGEQAEKVATRMRENVVNWAAGNGVELDISIGVSDAPQHGYSLDVLLEHADRALYSSKRERQAGSVRRAIDIKKSKEAGVFSKSESIHLH
ncbi:MAG: GGDEF domain-containing protein [Gammaproteobacteria bacterium]|nr:GGDEF domain-containing protein [Gammaproteobacteria bacterium]